MIDISRYADGQSVAFGAGISKEIGKFLEPLGVRRVLVLTTPRQSDLGLGLAERLGAAAAGAYTKATMHTPVSVSKDALTHLMAVGADSVLSAGGGSTGTDSHMGTISGFSVSS